MKREVTKGANAPLRKHIVKKRPEKFRVVQKVSPSTPFFMASLIEWKQKAEPLLISIPRTCGNAVLRNKWKRLVKEWFYSEGLNTIPGQNIWIRYNRTKTLKKPLTYKEWAKMLSTEAKKFKVIQA